MSLSTQAFRAALGTFVTGVTIVTTLDAAGKPAGLTANSFNSVSLDPPMVLWSLSLDSTNLRAFREASWWAVHVLSAAQQDLSDRFARRDAEKFEGLATTPGPGGIPLLDGSAARFVCRAAFEYEGGDHAIFLGEVRDFEQTGHAPLVYHRGRYGGVMPRPAGSGVALLESQGLVSQDGAGPRLAEALVDGLVGLAETRGMPNGDLDTLRSLLTRLI